MFKFKKSKIKIFSKPKEKKVNPPTPLKFSKTASVSSLAIKKNKLSVNKIFKSTKKIDNLNLTQEAFLPKLKIKSKSSAKEEISFKPTVVFLNEYVELFDGRVLKQKEDQNKTNLNGGNIRNVSLNQVARLIDLHYTLKKHTITISNREIYRTFNVSQSTVIYVKRNMKSLLRRNFKDLYDSNTLTFSKNLLDKFLKNSRIRNIDNDFLLMVAIQSVNKSLAKKIVKYLADVYDAKESIEDAISIQDKLARKNLKTFSPSRLSKASNASSSKRSNSIKTQRVKSSSPLSFARRVLGAGRTTGNPNKRNFSKRVFNQDNFDCNFKNYLFLLSKLEGLCSFKETVDNFDSSNVGRPNDMPVFDGGLSKSISALKELSYSGCLAPDNREVRVNQNRVINGSSLETILSLVSSESATGNLDELVASICYDQVVGANLKVNLQKDLLLETKGKSIKTFNEYFQNVFYKTRTKLGGRPNLSFESVMKDLIQDKDSGRVGTFMKALFAEKISSTGEKFIALENNEGIAAKEYENSEAFPGQEIFFTDALKNNDLTLQDIKQFSNLFSTKTDNIVNDITKIFSLDFDEEGNSESPDDCLINNLNPISYLNYFLNSLGDDLERTYDDDQAAAKSAFGMALVLNSGDNFSDLANSFKMVINGALLNTALGTTKLWTSNPLFAQSSKMEGVAKILSSEAVHRTEKLFIRLFEEQMGVENFPKEQSAGFPKNQGFFQRSITAPGGGSASGIGTFTGTERQNVTEFDKGRNSQPSQAPTQSSDNNSFFGSVIQNIKNVKNSRNNSGEASKTYRYGKTDDADSILMEYLSLGELSQDFTTENSIEGAVNNLVDDIVESVSSHLASALGADESSATSSQQSPSDSMFVINVGSRRAKHHGANITRRGIYALETLTNGPFNKVSTNRNLSLPAPSDEDFALIHLGETHEYFLDEFNTPGEFSFKENTSPNNFGGVFITNSVQRSLIFHLLAVSLLRKTQDVTVFTESRNGELAVRISKVRMKGLIYALQGKDLPSNPSAEMISAYDIASERINNIRSKISERQTKILDCLAVIKKHSDRFEDAHEDFISLIDQEDDNIRYKAAKEFLQDSDFYNTSIHALNYYFRDNILKNYFYNFAESNLPSSLFLASDRLGYRDIKIMKKVLSAPGYGFLKNEGSGKKQVFHVGIPTGTINYLRKESYKKTYNEDYLDSNLICIRVTKVDQLRTNSKYLPKFYVFDASKHIMPYYLNAQGNLITSNQIRRYHDLMSAKKVINQIDMLVFNERENFGYVVNGRGVEGIVGNINSELADNYEGDSFKKSVAENHVHDYYLKKYTELTLGIEIGEQVFLGDTEKEYHGALTDDFLVTQRNKSIIRSERNLRDTNNQEEFIFRISNSMSNALIFSSNDRIKTFQASPEFDRIYTILVNENDFLPNVSKSNIEKMFSKVPVISLGSQIQNTFIKPIDEETDNLKARTYLRSSTKGSSNISGYVFDIGLLPKW